MKLLFPFLLLFSAISTGYAAEKFAGIQFDSSVPNSQMNSMKEDLKYLFKSSSQNEELKQILETNNTSGAVLYNWIYNRIKYIIGESYVIGGRNFLSRGLFWSGFKFPNTPLPVIDRGNNENFGSAVVMSNIGANLYYSGKKFNELKGIRLDGEKVYAKSTRVGILQIGEGLFSNITAINQIENSEANKIQRLGTLFHEARHSDGQGRHLGFLHKKCPMGHDFSGLFACESYGNGAYKTGALTRKAFLQDCRTCTIEDKTKLEASIADALSRVVFRSHVKTKEELLKEIEMYKPVIKVYIDLIKASQESDNLEQLENELQRFKDKQQLCRDQLKEIETVSSATDAIAKPEGEFKEVDTKFSSKLMQKELNL